MKNFIVHHIAVCYMLIASFCFAVTSLFAKLLGDQMPSGEVVFWRNFIGLVLIVFSILLAKEREKSVGGHPFLLIFRGIIGVLSLLAFFYNVTHISLAAAFTFSKTSPIFTAIFCAVLLKERIGRLGWSAVVFGFVGILLVIQPHFGVSKTDIVGIIGGVGAALAYTSVRELRKFYETKLIVLSFMFFGSLVPLLFALFGGFGGLRENEFWGFLFAPFVLPDLKGWFFLALMGIFGTIFQVYITKAYAASRSAGLISAVSYTDIVFSTFFGCLLGDALPNALGFLGILVIVVAGVLVSLKPEK